MCIWHHALFPIFALQRKNDFACFFYWFSYGLCFRLSWSNCFCQPIKEKLQRKEHRNFESSETCPMFGCLLHSCQFAWCYAGPMQPRPVPKIEHNPLLNKKHFWLSRYKNMMDACQVNLGAVSAAGLMPGDDFLQNLGMDFYCWLLRQDHGFDGRHSHFKRWGTGHLISMWAAGVDFKRRQHWF